MDAQLGEIAAESSSAKVVDAVLGHVTAQLEGATGSVSVCASVSIHVYRPEPVPTGVGG